MPRKTPCGVLVVLVLKWMSISAQGDIGDSCVVKLTGERGTCKLSSDCPEAAEQADRGIPITICQILQITPVVCCENNQLNLPQPNEGLLSPLDTDSVSFSAEKEPAVSPTDEFLGIAEKKCQKYSKAVMGTVQAIPLVTNTEPISIDIEKCDYNSVALIVGGAPAAVGEFPFMAALGLYQDDVFEWKCGGTLISERYILTAGHCIHTRDGIIPSVIRLGDIDLTKTDDGSEAVDYEADVDNIVVHPEYKSPRKYNDIALMPTTKEVKFTKYIRPACLHTNNYIEQKTAVATGWGKIGYASENSKRLMKVSLNIYDNRQCSKTYGIHRNWPEGVISSMLCAGELKGGRDTCQGDSGGPLLVTKKGNQCKFYIVGITSFGKSCGLINTPAIYTRVSDYVPWIEKTIW